MKRAFAKLGNLHESGSAGGLGNVGQGNETTANFEISDSQFEVLELYDKARTLHLDEDFESSREIYSQIITSQELPIISAAARFFYGVTYFDELKFGTAEKYFKQEITAHPINLWLNSEYRFLAESLIVQGKIAEAKSWLAKTNSRGAQTRLKNLDQKIKPKISTPFVTY